MSKQFNSCVRRGGKIRTKSMAGGKYMHICILNGKSYAGEIKKKKSASKKRK